MSNKKKDGCEVLMKANIEEIQRLMDKNKWNKSQLAREIGVSRACISRIMNSQRNPGGDFLSAFKIRFPEYPLEKFFYADCVA
ncbi:MAG: helix-turn-helix protein [Firmicutes bacterium]|nr:helix-turn-helix protein [Bacillota bacterium]